MELKAQLESEGIPVTLQNVNLETPDVSSGMRVRIPEHDLPLALRIIENTDIFRSNDSEHQESSHSILVPVDFSEHSLKGAKVAFRIAAAHNADIVIIHSYIDPYIGSNIQLSDALTFDISAEAEARRQVEQSSKTQMNIFCNRLRSLIKEGALPPVKFESRVVEGVPEDTIDEYAKINTPYIIVMGTRGSDRKNEEMIGSVTAEVLDKCRVTVLSVPENFDLERSYSPRNILFLTNLDQGDILALDTMSRIFDKIDANVTLAQVTGKRRAFERTVKGDLSGLMRYCTKNYRRFTFDECDVPVEKDLNELYRIIRERHIDLIVVPNKKRRTLLGRLLNPGLAQRLVMGADVPMLVIRV